MRKPKRKENGSRSKSERKKLQRLYTRSKLQVSNVRHFELSKESYEKLTLETGKLRSLRAFARYKIEDWCMDVTYVDKLAKDNRGKNYLLVRQDVLDKTINVNKYFHKIPQFVTMLNTRQKRSIDMKPSKVKNSGLMAVLYSKPIRDFN